YLPLYVMAIGFVLVAVLLPTVNKTSSGAGGLGTSEAGVSGGPAGGGATAGAGSAAGGGQTGGSAVAGGGAGGAATGSAAAGSRAVPVAPGVEKPQVGTGTTRGGFPCTPGTRQLPWTQYTGPCVAAYSA